MKLFFWVAALILTVTVLPSGIPSAGQQFDARELERTEDLSEELANRLLDFSVAVRDREWEQIRSFLAPLVEMSPFPDISQQLSSGTRVGRWITRRTLDRSKVTSAALPTEAALAQLRIFLEQFETLDDVRWKVSGATFGGEGDEVNAESSFKFFLVGRDQSRRRLWAKGKGQLMASRSNDEWTLSAMRIGLIELQRADVDLFSEVSLPAGTGVGLPRYGEPGNTSFVYHGATAADIDGDGYPDVVVTGATATFLYQNRGDGTFREIGWEVGLPPLPQATAPLLVDVDNDGDLDLFVSSTGTQHLFENRLAQEGRLLFVDVSLEAGVSVAAHGFSATAGDVNSDGLVDIYVASYNRYGEIMPNSWHQATNGTPNLLFVNRGDGRFREEASRWGVNDGRWSYSAQFVDLNGDNRLDLYVVNDFGENALYVNEGRRFREAAQELGLLDPGNGMGVSFGDYNNDSRLDAFVTNMSSTAGNRILQRLFPDAASAATLRKLAAGNMLYEGQADGSFKNVTSDVGPLAGGWAWGGLLVDLDNDGWQDVYAASGFVSGKTMVDT